MIRDIPARGIQKKISNFDNRGDGYLLGNALKIVEENISMLEPNNTNDSIEGHNQFYGTLRIGNIIT